MRKLFEIDENEKRRILEMHENATKNLYLNEQGTPPSAASTASEGTRIDGRLYKIEKILDKASLNKFINWGILPSSADAESDTKQYDVRMANELGFAYEGSELPEKPAGEVDSEPVKKIKQVYRDLDKIAQNYQLRDLCRGKNLNLNLENEKSLTIAKNRAVRLGWCVGMG